MLDRQRRHRIERGLVDIQGRQRFEQGRRGRSPIFIGSRLLPLPLVPLRLLGSVRSDRCGMRGFRRFHGLGGRRP
ncbi:hypothetical protein MZTS_07735 [Methylorubrum zatmanii]|nr:hypothetical protein [Methylorubrum zatmanii]